MSDTDNLNLVLDERLEAYKTFFNHDWAQGILEAAKGTKFDPAVHLLTVNLRAAANCHTLPWLMIKSMSNLWSGFLENHELQANFINALAVELPKRMEGKISRMKQQEMGQVIRDLAASINNELAQHDYGLSPESLWKDYLDKANYEWVFSIWGSQRLVFGGLFFAFESFVKDVVAIAEGNSNYKGYPWKTLVSDTKKHFGDEVGKDCLEGDFIEITQLARHALAHNSGKETTKLKEASGHGLQVVDGLLQIQCPDNATLCKAIERRSLLLIQAAAKLPQFQI